MKTRNRKMTLTLGLLAGTMITACALTGCGIKAGPVDLTIPGTEKTVGKDIVMDDITEFYYTEENINYGAYYLRYRFYEEDGKYWFFYESREREDDYGPCTEEDATMVGTVELTKEQWTQFYNLVQGGKITAREDSAESGDTGPWLYLYWKGDKSKYQVFSFESYGKEVSFADYCVSLIPEEERGAAAAAPAAEAPAAEAAPAAEEAAAAVEAPAAEAPAAEAWEPAEEAPAANGRLTDAQAKDAIRHYCILENPDLENYINEGEYPVYWEVTESNGEQIVVLFRSYTGALTRYYIDPYSGDTYVTEQVPGIIEDEQASGETLNVYDYLNF